jgi:ABC-2 type transport system permease protein
MSTTALDRPTPGAAPRPPASPDIRHPHRIAAVVDDIRTMVRRSLRHSLRDAESLVMSVMLPVMLMLLFVYVFGGAINTGTTYVNYVVPGIILLCAGFGAAGTATSVARDMTTGLIDRFRSMRIFSGALLVGHVTASVVRNLVATAVVIGIGFAIGWRPHAGLGSWLGVAAMLVLYMAAISMLAALIGLFANSIESANAFTFVMMFLPYVSSAFVPPDTMPAFLRGFAHHQPVTPVIETLRSLLTGAPVGSNGWISVMWWGSILLVCLAGAGWLFRRKTRD